MNNPRRLSYRVTLTTQETLAASTRHASTRVDVGNAQNTPGGRAHMAPSWRLVDALTDRLNLFHFLGCGAQRSRGAHSRPPRQGGTCLRLPPMTAQHVCSHEAFFVFVPRGLWRTLAVSRHTEARGRSTAPALSSLSSLSPGATEAPLPSRCLTAGKGREIPDAG